MSHNPERYPKAEALDIADLVMKLRAYIGELEDQRQPTRSEVEEATDELFPNLLTNERSKVIEEFLESEAYAARIADQEDAQLNSESESSNPNTTSTGNESLA